MEHVQSGLLCLWCHSAVANTVAVLMLFGQLCSANAHRVLSNVVVRSLEGVETIIPGIRFVLYKYRPLFCINYVHRSVKISSIGFVFRYKFVHYISADIRSFLTLAMHY